MTKNLLSFAMAVPVEVMQQCLLGKRTQITICISGGKGYNVTENQLRGGTRMNTLMEYKGYHAKCYYSAEDGFLVGEVVGINDVLAFHGYSVDELEEMFHQSIDNYLELCERIGKEPDKEYRGMFNVRISPELHRLAALEAANRNITLNQLVSDILASALQQA